MKKTMKKYKWSLLSTLLLASISSAGYYTWHHKNKKPIATKRVAPTPVKTMTVQPQSLPINAHATGYLQAIENTAITPRVSGYIKAMPFNAGAQVAQGAVLFQLDNTKEKNALAAAKANAQLSKLQYKRNQSLLKKGFITHDLYYSSKVTMKQNAAALQTAQTNLADKKITAPFSGTLGAIDASIGDYVTPGKALTTLVDDKHLRVSYTLPAKDLEFIKPNQPVTIVSDTTNKKVTGHVTFISPTVDQDSQTILLHARFPNDARLFKPGEFIKITQHIGERNHVVLAPEQSVTTSLNGYSVFIAKHNKAVQVPVKVSDRQHGDFIVTSGLKPNMQLIIAGQDQIQDGQSIEITNKHSSNKNTADQATSKTQTLT